MAETSAFEKRPVGRPPRDVPRERILELRHRGRSFREIARETGCGYGTVRRAYWGAGACAAATERSG